MKICHSCDCVKAGTVTIELRLRNNPRRVINVTVCDCCSARILKYLAVYSPRIKDMAGPGGPEGGR